MADFSGDGRADVLLRHKNGRWLMFVLNGPVVIQKGAPKMSRDKDFSLHSDADFDGEVQFSDFLILSKNFGEDGSWSAGDFNSDGLVGFPDFLILSKNFGESAQNAASVPEPSGAIMIAIAFVVTLSRRRERGQGPCLQ